MVQDLIAAEVAAIEAEIGTEAFDGGHWLQARDLLLTLATGEEFVDFLTYEAYPLVD
jgi:malate synthase